MNRREVILSGFTASLWSIQIQAVDAVGAASNKPPSLKREASAMAKSTWPKATPEKAGFVPDLELKLLAGIQSGLLRDLHGVLVARNHTLVLEHYGRGEDYAWGTPLGVVDYNAEKLHDVRSVTKSIVGILYGIALDRGLVPSLDASLLAHFPEYPDLTVDPKRSRLTVLHALTMTLGLEWDEQIPYDNPKNSEIAMENAPDRYRYIFDRPIVAEPGAKWIYSGGAVALLGALIARGTGKPLPEFAREVLFEPLGISAFEWARGRDGVPAAASGLRLRARDLLRIGCVLLDKGVFNGKQIVPAGWIADSFKPAIKADDIASYGRLWYISDFARAPSLPGTHVSVFAVGLGGQRLYLMPDANLAVVTLSGQYLNPEQWVTPNRVWREIVVANLVRS